MASQVDSVAPADTEPREQLAGPAEGSASERHRILAEYHRREAAVPPERYAASSPAEIFMRQGRARVAARALTELDRFPVAGDACLEIGHGRLGWLAELLGWGVRESDLSGIELDPDRAATARHALPGADLRVGDASRLPWPDGRFRLVVLSTVLSSILDEGMTRSLLSEAARVLDPEGALLIYDLARKNPRNANVRPIVGAELERRFPGFRLHGRRVTLAPPLVRAIAPRSWLLASMLESVPWLRTHRLYVLTPDAAGSER